jgi:hypothetical protein
MKWQDRFWRSSYGGFRRDLEEATMTPVRRVLGLFAAAALVTACPSQTQTLANKQGAATEAALQRGRFDLNCPSATATVLSSDYVQPAVQGPWVSGLQRAEYTVGVEGCNQRTTYVVLCQVGTETCFAANPRDQFRPR